MPFRLTAFIHRGRPVSEKSGSAQEALGLLRRWNAFGYLSTRVTYHGKDVNEAELILLVEGTSKTWTPESHEKEADMNEIARPKI